MSPAMFPARAPAAVPARALLAGGVAAMLAGGGASAAGAGPLPGAAVELDPVVVSATRTDDRPHEVPASIDVVTGAELRTARAALNLAESLWRVPGVVVRDRQNQAQDLQISIRGFGARATFGVRGLRLLADGIPASMPDGQGQVSHFALEAADRIEVLRGPFSALHGNAAGGVIAVFSAPAPDVPEAEVALLAGSDGLWRAGASWRGPLDAAAHHGLRVDAARTAGDGWRERSAWRRDGAQALLRGTFDGGATYTVLFNHLDLKAEDPQGLNATELSRDRRAASPNSVLFGARKTVEQAQLGARVEQPFGDAQSLALTGWRGRRQTFQILTVPVFAQANPTHGGGVIDLDRDYHGVDARWQWRAPDERATLTAGVSREVAAERRRGFENFVGGEIGVVGALRRDERNRVTSDDVYLQGDWRPGARWRVNAGLRHTRVRFASADDYVTADNPDDSGALAYSRMSPALGVLFRASDAVSVYANAGSGFETPTFAELAYRLDGGTGLDDSLRPARSRHAELGLRATRGEARFGVALFGASTRDELVVVANQGGRSYYDNAGRTRRRGAEFSLSMPLGARWDVAAAYTWLDARYREDFGTCATPPCSGDDLRVREGAWIPGLARHTGWVGLRWRARADTDVLLEARGNSAVHVDDRNSATAPGYVLIDAGVEHRFGTAPAWRVFARVDNLLDRETVGSVIVNEGNGRFFEPAPGRRWQLGLSAVW